MLLSIGMMVKNEEKHLEECLESLKPLLNDIESELIIVDTGSTDRTVEIAKMYTEKVYFHEWNNDFSEMRNKTISYCTGEWFFCIDGDEVLEDAQCIIDFFKDKEYLKCNTGILCVKNYTNSKDYSKYTLTESKRLFKRDNEFKYAGSVHNQPVCKGPLKKVLSTLNHYGYILDDEELMERKFKRTSMLLKKELEKNPDNIYYRFQLSVSYAMHNDIEEALEIIRYAYDLLQEDKKLKFKSVLNQHAYMLFQNKKFIECIESCEKSLNLTKEDEIYKIDLYFYIANSQAILGDYKNSIINFNTYLNLLNKFESGKLPVDVSISTSTRSLKNEALSVLAEMYLEERRYDDLYKCLDEISIDSFNRRLVNIIVNAVIKTKDISLLEKMYNEKICKSTVDIIKLFNFIIEEKCLKLEEYQRAEIRKVLSEISEHYSYKKLNELRICKDQNQKKEIYNEIINEIDLDTEENYFGDILIIALDNKYNIEELLEKISYKKIIDFMAYCREKNNEFDNVLFKYIKENNLNNTRVMFFICRELLISDILEDRDFNEIFEKYISSGIEILKRIYVDEIIETSSLLDIENSEHKFIIYMFRARQIETVNKSKYLKCLSKAVKVYPCMKRGIETLLEKVKKEEKDRKIEISKLQDELINSIDYMIASNRYSDALDIIEEAEKVIGKSLELLIRKSEILLAL